MTVVSGTNRPSSRSRMVAGEIQGIYQSLGEDCQLLDLVDLPAEVFLGSAYEKKPDAFVPFSEAILGAAGVVFVTPEYNGSFPGVLKYFIDMLNFPESLEGTPVCLVGLAAGSWGALRPVEQLQQIFAYRKAPIFPTRVLLPEVDRVMGEGGRISDPEIRSRLERQAAGFVEFVRLLRPAL